jgi:hypothetical protein
MPALTATVSRETQELPALIHTVHHPSEVGPGSLSGGSPSSHCIVGKVGISPCFMYQWAGLVVALQPV